MSLAGRRAFVAGGAPKDFYPTESSSLGFGLVFLRGFFLGVVGRLHFVSGSPLREESLLEVLGPSNWGLLNVQEHSLRNLFIRNLLLLFPVCQLFKPPLYLLGFGSQFSSCGLVLTGVLSLFKCI